MDKSLSLSQKVTPNNFIIIVNQISFAMVNNTIVNRPMFNMIKLTSNKMERINSIKFWKLFNLTRIIQPINKTPTHTLALTFHNRYRLNVHRIRMKAKIASIMRSKMTTKTHLMKNVKSRPMLP